MMGHLDRRALQTAVLSVSILGACGARSSGECLGNDVGQICADRSDGAITFSGSGLAPDSEVRIDHPDLGVSTFTVGTDGTFEPDGRGVVSFFAGTPFTFTVSATDADGRPIDGELDVAS